ncbi:MAG TPA: hypothetical protein VFU05_04375 [Cyclobacteriaceae bacterium]|nr:hypothetical protein [Cyclobacteriaceae bacterium]
MKRMIAFLVVALIVISSCASEKPAYKTAKGKRKLKYYNALQFGQKEVPKPKF